MSSPKVRQRPLLTLPQILLLVALFAGMIIAVDLNRRAQIGRVAGIGEGEVLEQIHFEETRQVELEATRSYVNSDEYVADFARNEANYTLPGEKRVVILPQEVTRTTQQFAEPTPDPIQYARPWQGWLRLLTDAPQPQK
jgi:hypothetical protein